MNSIDVLKYGHQTVLDAVEGLPERDWHTPNVCGVWSVKQIVAHLASFEHLLVDILNGLQGSESAFTLARFLEDEQLFNDHEVKQRQHRSVAEVWAEYRETYQQAAGLLAAFPGERLRETGILPWYGETYDLQDLIVYSYYGHKREHCAQIAVFRDQLGRAA